MKTKNFISVNFCKHYPKDKLILDYFHIYINQNLEYRFIALDIINREMPLSNYDTKIFDNYTPVDDFNYILSDWFYNNLSKRIKCVLNKRIYYYEKI